MRSEKEMFDLTINEAKKNNRVRAVYMNGSRANPNAQADKYRDYDIVYTVTETTSFIENKDWIYNLGNPLIIQEPDSNDLGWGIDHDFTRRYAWLMLFDDGNRIDLSIEIKEETDKNFTADTLTVPLLDKDGIFPEIPPSNDSGYWINPPAKERYYGCCNEFWWCLNNVAKGIVRDQLPYAMRMYTEVVHIELEKMTEWYIGINNNFSVSSGMWGKYFKKYLPVELYEKYIKTYSNGDYDNLWAAIFTACEMFHEIAPIVGEKFGYSYNKQEGENIIYYILQLKNNTL